MMPTTRPARKPRPPAPPLVCRDCGRPFATLQNGVLIIQSRHGGADHINVITLADLRALLDAVEQTLDKP